MNSSVPYLVKAIKEWIQDNGLTPYLVINAEEDARLRRKRRHVEGISARVPRFMCNARISI